MMSRCTWSLPFAAVLAACQPNVGDAVAGSIAGAVVKGPVHGAHVSAFSVDADGRRDKKLAETDTDDAATFALNVGGHFGPALVCARDGSFTEEATGGLVDLGPNELCALVDDHKLAAQTTGVLITPLTTLRASLAGCLAETATEPDLASASRRATGRLNTFFSAGIRDFDLRSTNVFDPTTDAAPSLTADVWHGLLLAGLSESARQISLASDLDPGVRVTSATLTTELARDIDDNHCIFDGLGPSGALTQGSVALSSNTLRGAPEGLALSIERFVAGEHNKSGVTVDSIKDLTRALASDQSDIFAPTPAAPPTVTILDPLEGTVAGRPAIRVIADDVSGLSQLAFIAPQPLVGTGDKTCSSPSHCELVGELNTALVPAGRLTITARATNTSGVSSDASVNVIVNNDLPIVTVSSPSPGTVSNTVNILAQASSPAGIASFDVEAPGLTFLAACSPPAVTTNCDREPDPTKIDVLWDTKTVPEGPLSLTFAATDTAAKTAFTRVDVEVDNVAAGTISGVVDLGFPVIGASVTAFDIRSGVRGDVLGTAAVDDQGRYQIENADFVGAVEVVATGGSFEDSSTGQTLSLRAGQELVAAVPEVAPGVAVVANINAWTTLAATRALATQGDSPSVSAAITFNSNLVASHLLRPGALSLTGSVSSNLLQEHPAPSDSAAIIALAHAGLSRLAAQVSIDVGGAPGQITPADLLQVLLADVSDGVLDGSDDGAALFLDQQFVGADANVLRTSLAIAIDNFVKNAPFRHNGVVALAVTRNGSGITSDALAGQGLLYDDLALDRSILFPADAPVIPFDQTPPTIGLSFAAPNEGAASGDSLDGVVAVLGTASDISGLSSFDVQSPELPDLFSPVADLRVEIDGSIPPNQADVLARCGLDVTGPPLSIVDPSREVCVCTEATDALDNVAHAIQCFTRPRPRVTTDATAFVGPARAGINVAATGSFDLLSCAGSITQGTSTVVGTATADATGNRCALFVPFTAPLQPGSATLHVDVIEIGGAVSRSSFTYTADLTPPTVAITAPAAGSLRAAPPLITASASDANLVSVVADVTSNALPVATGLVGVIGITGAVTFPAFTDAQPDGLRTITVTATDAAGNAATSERSYTKDTTPPALSNLTAADGNPLSHFQLTATTAFSPSPQCSTFPFDGCVFNIDAATTKQDVDLRTSASSVETYRRWQHLANAVTNPSTLTNPAAENRAPTLRLKTEPGMAAQARIDATCPADDAFEDRARGNFTANSIGLVDVPIVDAQNLTSGSTLLRNQTGSTTLCLSLRPTDGAGNKGAIVHHFFKYEATPAPLFMLWNAGAYNPKDFNEDVESFDSGHDDKVLSGTAQGAAGRVFAHAYLVSPSTSTSYNYSYTLNTGTAPTITVHHREVLHISKVRAFNWCHTLDGSDGDAVIDDDDDDLVNPDDIVANEANSPPNNPTWTGTTLDKVSDSSSWALFSATGGNLLSATAHMEHHAVISGEQDTTFSHSPATSYSTSADTTELGQLFQFGVPLNTVSVDVWNFNTVTGQPSSLISSGTTLSFSAGGSSSGARHKLLLFRAPVPQNALTLKTALTLNGQSGTIGFNDPCNARNSSGTAVAQMFTMPDNQFVIADASLPSGSEPAAPHTLLWVKSGQFTECKGDSTHDCRYGRYFDDYVDALFSIPAGRALTTQGQIGAVSGAPFKAQTDQHLPDGQTRALAQEQ